MLTTVLTRAQVLEAVEALRRRSLIERGNSLGSFTLQSVVLEYVTGRLIDEVVHEIKEGRLARLIEHRLAPANVKEYVWQTLQRLIVAPLLAQLRNVYRGREEVEQRLLWLLDQLRQLSDYAQGYGPANCSRCCVCSAGTCVAWISPSWSFGGRRCTGSRCKIPRLPGRRSRSASLPRPSMPSPTVAISPDGQYWAAGSRRGEVRVWHEAGQTLHLVWQAHTDFVWGLAFSPDGRTLASGSPDGSLKLWDVESGALLWSGWQTKAIICLAFAPDGSLLASGGHDATVRLWDAKLGTQLQTCRIPARSSRWPGAQMEVCWPVATSPARSGCGRGSRPGRLPARRRLRGIAIWVRGLAFAPDGSEPRQRELGWHRQALGDGQRGALVSQTLVGAYGAGAMRRLESGWRHTGQWRL